MYSRLAKQRKLAVNTDVTINVTTQHWFEM